MHDHDAAEASHAQIARARTRGSVPHRGRGGQPDPETATDSVRSALDVARQKWGVGTGGSRPEEPVQDTPEGPAGTDPAFAPLPEGSPAARRRPVPEHPMPFGSWSGASLPLRETWATYAGGAARVIEASPVLVIPYWIAGVPAFLLHVTFRLGQDSTTSVTRSVVFAIVVAVLVTGIAVAL